MAGAPAVSCPPSSSSRPTPAGSCTALNLCPGRTRCCRAPLRPRAARCACCCARCARTTRACMSARCSAHGGWVRGVPWAQLAAGRCWQAGMPNCEACRAYASAPYVLIASVRVCERREAAPPELHKTMPPPCEHTAPHTPPRVLRLQLRLVASALLHCTLTRPACLPHCDALGRRPTGGLREADARPLLLDRSLRSTTSGPRPVPHRRPATPSPLTPPTSVGSIQPTRPTSAEPLQSPAATSPTSHGGVLGLRFGREGR